MLIFPLFISGALLVVMLVVICSVKVKRIVLALGVLCTIYSCNKVAQPLTREQITQKADSLSGIRIRQADEQAKTDLEYRLKIEVKVKVDSILSARMLAAKTDTIKKPKTAILGRLPKPLKSVRAGSVN